MSENLKLSSLLFAGNAHFIEELYDLYLKDPLSVDSGWQEFFRNINDNELSDANLNNSTKFTNPNINNNRSIVAVRLIDAYRNYGHYNVELDPLNIAKITSHPELNYKSYGLIEEDLTQTIDLQGYVGFKFEKLSNLIDFLTKTYAGKIGSEFMHIEDLNQRQWIQNKLEKNDFTLTDSEKLKALETVIHAEMFENFVHVKFPGTKRFSIEGLENSIVAIESVIIESVNYNVSEFVLGMAHRGRLNTLTKIMNKPYRAMFAEFKGELAFPTELGIPGDVKYHLGVSSDIKINNKSVHMTLTPNPSHLEVVNSVVLGKVRAKQDLKNDKERSSTTAILIHGDAAFAGQGSVMEALALSQLEGYHTGGTIHIITNNQIGFTTNPKDARSSSYCTDIAKFIDAPIFHVNGDDTESIVKVCKLAAQYRATFKCDVIIDIVGYRKYGHNEGDEPLFTQPIMYHAIKNKKNPAEVFSEKMVLQNLLTEDEVTSIKTKFKQKLDSEFESSQDYKVTKADWLEGNWSEFNLAARDRKEISTGVEISKLKDLGKKICQTPKNFNTNTKVSKILENKATMYESGQSLDWAAGESLAFASLLDDGYPIRITGQDVERGTFSHRHAVLTDQESENKYIPLNNIKSDQKARLEIKNSNLSEFAVLGFEYGYSFTHPSALTIWEAQFGDFANGAQVVIDQYIASGEAKWLRMNGLVMLLPHGYEGQGPEHSSARLERFLQLCAKDNMQVINPTTPASLFHALRRQVIRNFRKPLIVMSPKSLLRHKLAVSNLSEFNASEKFKLVIGDTQQTNKKNVKKVILCSGKIYYDLIEQKVELKRTNLVIIRLEQLYPFPVEELHNELKEYPFAQIFWCQEEHKNMGAYHFVKPRILKILEKLGHRYVNVAYIGRESSASPAVGYMKLHVAESKKILNEVFDL